MTTYINNTTKSTNKDIKIAAMKAGYYHHNRKVSCPMCTTARCSALRFDKKYEIIYACACGYRRKDVQDGNNSVIDKRNAPAPTAKKAPKSKKAPTKSKAKEMVNPGMPINM